MPRIFLSSSVDGELIRYVERCLHGAGETERFVTVSESGYRAAANGGRLTRLGLRLRMYFWHPLRMVLRMLLTPKGSVWVVTTNPFFAPAIAAIVGKLRGQRVVHLLYDLFPDALEEAGLIDRNGWIARCLGYFPKQALRHSSVTVFLGDSLKTHAEARWGAADQSLLIPVVLSQPLCEKPHPAEDGPVGIHYGGQLGWMHDAELLAKLVSGFQSRCAVADPQRAHWFFNISGAKAAWFRQTMMDTGVELSGTLPVDEWRERALSTEVGLVSLSEGGARVCLPSKTFGMMACGMAILAVCPKDSDLAQVVESSEAGWVVDTSVGNQAVLQSNFNKTVASILDHPEERTRRRENALKHVAEENRKDLIENRWHSLFKSPKY